jgi:hypothetical protein
VRIEKASTVIRLVYGTVILALTSIEFLNLMGKTTPSILTQSLVDTGTTTIEQQTSATFDAPLIVTVTSPVLPNGQKSNNNKYNSPLPIFNRTTTTLNTISTITTATPAATNSSWVHPRKWAYAFLMAAVDPQTPAYRGILYNIMVAAEILQDSKADILVMIQMSRTYINNNNEHRLPSYEEQWLRDMNVKIEYLDVPPVQNFYQVQFEKFRILNHTEYSRILYLDGDVMPYCVLDYLFELSDPSNPYQLPLLKENLVLSWSSEPAHGGFFLLAPQEGDYETIQQIIDQREQEAMQGTELIDKNKGWGHVITQPDHVSKYENLTYCFGVATHRNFLSWEVVVSPHIHTCIASKYPHLVYFFFVSLFLFFYLACFLLRFWW